ncbi:hypothetical protein B14911_15187 [Bacillus sp. NRRL B-14911]|nr:hypothetical protein B14911_15187 [Bacillus sp. NRRL B-14911]
MKIMNDKNLRMIQEELPGFADVLKHAFDKGQSEAELTVNDLLADLRIQLQPVIQRQQK